MANKPQNIHEVLDKIEREVAGLAEYAPTFDAIIKQLQHNLDEQKRMAPGIEAAVTQAEREGAQALLEAATEQAKTLDSIAREQTEQAKADALEDEEEAALAHKE